MKRLIISALLLCIIWLGSASAFAAENNPQAAPEAIVTAGNARFTVLTSRLIRAEWSEDGQFEDRATLTFINRRLPVPEYTVSQSRSKVVIKTKDLVLTYRKGDIFSAENLKAEFMMNGKKVVWHFGDNDSLNLMGTTRTLDKVNGWKFTEKDPMEQGILSRSGWSVVDDSKRHLLVPVESHWGNWVETRAKREYRDIYLFAYGHKYTEALGDYIKVAGEVPLPPRYAFGYWWSRYWQYSDSEFRDLVGQIRSFDIPIDVLIVDMDWHETWGLRRNNPKKDEYGQRIGWTGYTWKEQLFPSPENFLRWCRNEKLRTSLNLHPASGIQPYEEPYERFVEAYGWKEKGKSVPFHIDEQKWADAYFETVLGTMEKMGVDFWWLYWQQWKESKYTEGLSNTFWLNHVFNHHATERNNERPMIYHRWGGLGSHRYQIGFSGDTYTSWETLGFMPWFTATASNVCYGYWGHDIGGHAVLDRKSPTNPEIYLRWLQHAVFTPIFKTHCTRYKNIERRIWQFPDHMFMMRDAIRLRYNLAPYIYNAARATFDTGVSMCRPMYYYYPEIDEAYDMKQQYMFGDDLLVSVIDSPIDQQTGLATCEVWFPEGKWYDMSSGAMIEGGRTLTLNYTLAENPYFARAGAIIPMNPPTIKSLQEPIGELVLTLIPGGSGEVTLYEDDGLSKNYAKEFATTKITSTVGENSTKVVIAPRKGEYADMPSSRSYTLRLPAQMPPKRVVVNGKELGYDRFISADKWSYNGDDLAIEIAIANQACDKECVVEIEFDAEMARHQPRLYGKRGIFARCKELTPLFKERYADSYDPYSMLPDPYLNVSQTPNFITEHPERIVEWIERYEVNKANCVEALKALKTVDNYFLHKLEAQFEQNN